MSAAIVWAFLIVASLLAPVCLAMAGACGVALWRGRVQRRLRGSQGADDRGPLRYFADDDFDLMPLADRRPPKRWPDPAGMTRADAARALAYASIARDRSRWFSLAGELFFIFGGASAGAGAGVIVGSEGPASAQSETALPTVAAVCLLGGIALGGLGYFSRSDRTPFWSAVAEMYYSAAAPPLPPAAIEVNKADNSAPPASACKTVRRALARWVDVRDKN
jgi:hypothetical protein